MALIEKIKGRGEKQTPSGYTRLFGIAALGSLISRTHGASISAGTELEQMIWQRVRKIENLDEFLENAQTSTDGVWVAHKKQIKQSTIIKSAYEPDFLGFDLASRTCYIVEVKDGDQFDTKKAAGEHKTLHDFKDDIASAITFKTKIYLCSFNSRTVEEAYDGLKHKFAKDELLTGKDLCNLFGIDYEDIVSKRCGDQARNLEYFTKSLLDIPDIKSAILKILEHLKK